MRPDDERYFERIESRLEEAFDRAEAAKAQGRDPEPEIEIPVARDMADRVENILGIDGVAERVRELEGEMSREEAALELVTDFVEGSVGEFDSRAGKVEGAVRTAVALLTEGVVAAPIEGIDRVELLQNDDGTEFINVYYAGPIRSAGGTAQALSVLVADYARSLLDIEEYHARSDEIERYAEEVSLYDKETGLQYSPKDKETKFIAEHLPIMLDGEATGDEEVSGFRDLDRVDTNSARGGMCLVLAEGIALKAPKIQRYTRELEEVDWPWLQDLIDGTIGEENAAGDGSSEDTGPGEADVEGEGSNDEDSDETGDAADERSSGGDGTPGPPRPEPSEKFLRDLIAGRPVFSHPSEPGGFRLRYGRARNHGFATGGIHPATMHIVDDFLAAGTQIKTERPGKAHGIVPVDSIEGPTVRLANGDVRRIDDPEEALEVHNGVEEIIDAGEYLVNYGEFVENNHPLAPASYTVEWWVQEFDAAGADVQALRDDPHVDLADPTVEEALSWAREYDCPLHPTYTYLWHDVDVETFEALAEAVADGEVVDSTADHSSDAGVADGGVIDRKPSEIGPAAEVASLVIERTETTRRALELLLVEHTQTDETLEIPTWRPLARSLGIDDDLQRTWESAALSSAREYAGGDNAVEAVNAVAPFEIRERAPTRIGNRMGRPEKSESRELSPAVHALFPITEAGGSQRDIAKAAKTLDDRGRRGMLDVDINDRVCPGCGDHTYHNRCPDCEVHTELYYECGECGTECEPDESGRVVCPRCEWDVTAATRREIDLNERFHAAMESVAEREAAFDVLKGVKGLSSEHKVPEPIEKGILRAKHGVSSFKDGTVRYDMTDLPVTAVRPAELDVTADQFRELGYHADIDGEPLRHDDQLVELKVQDIVLSDGAAEHMMNTADFVDELLEDFYDLPPFYELEDREDLVGELVFGMAPHTSAATVGRVVGFTSAAVGYAHPYFHAAKRRNCFHPETQITFDDGDGWRTTSIRDLVEERLRDSGEEDLDEDNFGTLTRELDGTDGELRVRSVDAVGTPTPKPVSAVSKHPSQDHLLWIRTSGGNEIRVTPDHTMLRLEDGTPSHVSASELAVGDEVPAATMDEGTAPVGGATASGGVDALVSESGDVEHDEVLAVDADQIVAIDVVESDVEYTYNLTVEETHTVVADGIAAKQCDGDEDCVMLLMDGLLNFSRQYLPDKRGGSVAEDARLVAVDPDDRVQYLTFDELWHALDAPVEVDGKFRKRTCVEEGWQTYAFDANHEASLKPIEKAIRYRADEDDELLRVETQFGRSLEITPNHSLFRYDDGIEEVAGENLGAGDLIVAPQSLDIDPTGSVIDVAECVPDPYVFIDDRVEEYLRRVWENADHGSETRAAFDGGLSYRLSKKKVSLETLAEIETTSGKWRDDWNPKIGLKGSSEGIQRYITLDEDFAWLLGMFAAEGSLSSTRPTIHNGEEELVRRVERTTEDSLGTGPTVRWSNKAYEVAFPAVFREVLFDLGFADKDSYNSSEKVVPDPILRSEKSVVKAFLRGFIAGDGSETSNDNHTTIGFHTTSEDLKDGIVFLLHRLGIVANISRKERDESRQPIYTVSVSGGAADNPLRKILDDEEMYQPKSLVVTVPDALMEIREMDLTGVKQLIPKYLKRRENISLEKLEEIVTELDGRELPSAAADKLTEIRPLIDGDLSYLRITDIDRVDYEGYLYDLQVGGEPIFTANWLYAHNSMDAPLVMSSRIDPSEIDDEAHNMDIVREYPLEFYEATRRMADPGEVEELIQLGEDTLGTDDEYRGFDHTHDTTDIAMGPDLSAYKTLGSMMDKMDAQLELARKLRAVDETDVAERVIEYHFLPDLIGNLRAFARQETRCLDCETKYRRMPLSGECRNCGGTVNLTVHEGSVNKYMDTAIEVADRFDCREYTKQRLEILDQSLESIFEDDTNKQSGIADFM
ncbi:DNA polymerase II large subunit [Halalkaliarchaeum sp. AArc-GB]|uniref:DNA polymerase II large subunit n=1 Tax=Halalkaliarchaeum sp. AArc-GB TaxID=3074078 RepID=UPI00285FE0A5|nr:DNA polymerase II large subunit [Halalkaliarchaeum sp. AArc-GB]MDR5674560.1 DNA polymerase II large subunit [Halalkaliarchaeum sp. AArc-GB]